MKKTLLLLASLSLCASQANAVVLSFDDIPGGSIQNTAGEIPTYKGFNFVQLIWADTEGSSWSYGAVSGDFIMSGAYGIVGAGTITEENGADFTFDGLWAKKYNTPKDSGGIDSLFGALQGYNNGALIWSVDTSLNGSYEYYGAQAGLIDELKFGLGASGFLVDDLALNVSPVPEPSSIALMLGGLGLVGFMATRRAKKG